MLLMIDWDGYMKRIKMKDNATKFIWDGDNCVGKYTELIEQYHYDSEEEKQTAYRMIQEADVMICGEDPGKYVKNKKQLVFWFSERIFKKETKGWERLIEYLRAIKNHTLKENAAFMRGSLRGAGFWHASCLQGTHVPLGIFSGN